LNVFTSIPCWGRHWSDAQAGQPKHTLLIASVALRIIFSDETGSAQTNSGSDVITLWRNNVVEYRFELTHLAGV
jgi:hypothetical protein